MKLFITVVAVLAFGGCFESPVSHSTHTSYDVVLYRDDKTVESTGWLKFGKTVDDKVSGTWNFDGINGDGLFEGTIVAEEYRLNLHPGWADHNLFLRGKFGNGSFNGSWEFVGFAGPMEQGTFNGSRQTMVDVAH